jgi:primary-amine oxidase
LSDKTSFLESEHSGRAAIPPPRIIYTNFYFKNSSNFHEALVDITAGKVVWQHNLGSKVHAPGTPEEMERMHEVAMRSDLVKKEIQRLKLVEGTEVVCEPWPYGKDGINDDERLFQVTFDYHSVLMAVLLLPCIHRSQEEAPFSQSLRPSSRLLLHCRRSS